MIACIIAGNETVARPVFPELYAGTAGFRPVRVRKTVDMAVITVFYVVFFNALREKRIFLLLAVRRIMQKNDDFPALFFGNRV